MNCSDKTNYDKLIDFMIANSDAFSLVYFKYKENEKLKHQAKSLSIALKPFKIFQKNTNIMPSMITVNQNKHIYNLTIYKACAEVLPLLKSVDSLWEWDYPYYPMDLCFFRNGYAWFVSSAHENYNSLNTDDKEMISAIGDLDLHLSKCDDVSSDWLFYFPDISKNAILASKLK